METVVRKTKLYVQVNWTLIIGVAEFPDNGLPARIGSRASSRDPVPSLLYVDRPITSKPPSQPANQPSELFCFTKDVHITSSCWTLIPGVQPLHVSVRVPCLRPQSVKLTLSDVGYPLQPGGGGGRGASRHHHIGSNDRSISSSL
jgi:hypothetical protein